MKRLINLIIASDKNNGIGYENGLPWSKEYGSDDMNNFVKTTLNGILIMGRSTAESLGNKPLPKRVNIILSKSMEEAPKGFLLFNSIEAIEEFLEKNYLDKNVWVIGGRITATEFLRRQLITNIVYTRFNDSFMVDLSWDIMQDIKKTFIVNSTKVIKNGKVYYMQKVRG